MEDNMQAPAPERANRLTGNLPGVITINEEQIRDHLGEVVRGKVEQTQQALLEADAVVRRAPLRAHGCAHGHAVGALRT